MVGRGELIPRPPAFIIIIIISDISDIYRFSRHHHSPFLSCTRGAGSGVVGGSSRPPALAANTMMRINIIRADIDNFLETLAACTVRCHGH